MRTINRVMVHLITNNELFASISLSTPVLVVPHYISQEWFASRENSTEGLVQRDDYKKGDGRHSNQTGMLIQR